MEFFVFQPRFGQREREKKKKMERSKEILLLFSYNWFPLVSAINTSCLVSSIKKGYAHEEREGGREG